MTRDEYERIMALRAATLREAELERIKAEYYKERLRQNQERERIEQERIAIRIFQEAQAKAEAAKPKKSAIAMEAEKGNVIDAEFEEVKPEKSPSKLIPRG